MTATTTTTTAGDDRAVTGLEDAVIALRALVLSSVRYRHRLATDLGIGENELTALGHLRPEGHLTPRELTDLLGLTSGSVTGLVDRLEKAGYCSRVPHPSDRRSVLVEMTPAGRHAIDWVFQQFAAALREGLDDSAVDLAALVTGMQSAAAAVRRHAVD